MVYSTSSNGLSNQALNVPGVVLAVSPDGADGVDQRPGAALFYLYSLGGSGMTTFSGMGNAAHWTPDSQTLYITDNSQLNTPVSCGDSNITGHSDMLYVFNKNTGWSTYTLPPTGPLPSGEIPSCTAQANVWAPPQMETPAVMVPSVGAYLRGTSTVAHTWCPSGTVGRAPQLLPHRATFSRWSRMCWLQRWRVITFWARS